MDYLDITGDYEADFPNIRQMFKDLAETVNTTNWEGEIITHQFTTTSNETIAHNRDKIPTKVLPLLQEGAVANFQFVSATDTGVVLKSGDSALKLTFYLE